MIVLVVNGNRHLFNDQVIDKAQDECAERIISAYPDDAIVEFNEVRDQDIQRKKYI